MKDSGVGFWDMTTMIEASFLDATTNMDTLTSIEIKNVADIRETVIVELPTVVLQNSTPEVRSTLPVSKEEDPLFHQMAQAPLEFTGTMRLDVEKPMWRGWGPLLISLMLTTASILALVQA